MNFKDAMTLASDVNVGFDSNNKICLFVHGRGIPLNSSEEIWIARDIEKAMSRIAKGSDDMEHWPQWKRDYKLTEYS